MKKNLLVIALASASVLAFYSCSNEETTPPTVTISSPSEGSNLNVYAPFTVKAEGEAGSGEISKVTLTIGTQVIPGITTLPFEYEVPAETFPVGSYTITVEVENSKGLAAKDMKSFTLSDQNVAPTCSLSSDVAGKEIEPEDVVTLKGEASDQDGSIASVVLKINGKAVDAVTSVPFEYELSAEEKTEGEVKASLEVTDNNGKTASSEFSFTVLGRIRSFTDPRDNRTYRTVKIGKQLWFAQDLAYLPSVNAVDDYSKTEAKYYVYDYNGTDVDAAKATDHYKNYGVLYNWHAVGGSDDFTTDNTVGKQGPCPEGWHVPAYAEWDTLFNYVRKRIPESESATYWDGSTIYNVNGHLRTKTGWKTSSDTDFPQLEKGGFDTYDFSATVTGCYYPRNGFYYGPSTSKNDTATYWTQHFAPYSPSNPGGMTVSINSYRYEPSSSKGTDTSRAHAVRCIKD